MILDNIISYNTKIAIALFSGAIWIYTRDEPCYYMIPRKKILPVLFVVSWIYLNYLDPLFLPLGLLILYIYSLTYRTNYPSFLFYKRCDQEPQNQLNQPIKE